MRMTIFKCVIRGCTQLVVLGLLGACGGGWPFGLPPGLTVSEITPTSVPSYSRPVVVRIRGTDLDQGIRVDAPGCATFVETDGSTSAERSYTCVVNVVGALQFSVIDKTGTTLRSTTQQVPKPQVSVVTSLGSFVMELDPVAAPVTVDNFLKYTATNFYTNLIFHRVIAGFVVQTGGYASGLTVVAPTSPPIALESNNKLKNVTASVAMARTNDPASASSQFFINLMDNTSLDYQSAASPGYAVFGKVVSGFEVVGLIGAVPTGTAGGLTDVPVSELVLLSATQTR